MQAHGRSTGLAARHALSERVGAEGQCAAQGSAGRGRTIPVLSKSHAMVMRSPGRKVDSGFTG